MLNHHLNVLLVDDEFLVRSMIADFVSDLGHVVVAEANDLPSALERAREADYDLAVLDINLNGQHSYPVVDAVRERGRALILATGYPPNGLDDHGCILLQKPFCLSTLAKAIDAAVAKASVDALGSSPAQQRPLRV